MIELLAEQRAEITEPDRSTPQRALDRIVGFQAFAALGALVAGIAPALMATAGGSELEGSVSAYYDVEPRYFFWLPFTAAGVLLLLDGAFSYVSPNRARFGRRWYNLVLGVALLLLTWFDLDSSPGVHYPAAAVFFALFIAVIAYTSLLGVAGRLVERAMNDDVPDRPIDRVFAEVSLVFMGLLLVTLLAWAFDLISFYFFELFALVNFALYYVQGLVNPFPYNDYEFTIGWLNRILRALRIMEG